MCSVYYIYIFWLQNTDLVLCHNRITWDRALIGINHLVVSYSNLLLANHFSTCFAPYKPLLRWYFLLTETSQVVSVFGCTLKVFLVTLDEGLDLFLFPVPHWKTQNSMMIPYHSNGQKSKTRFPESTRSKVYPATEGDSLPGSQG